jgi:hypothetical protein
MINGVAIYGGFAGAETAVNQRTNYSRGESNETILSGDIGSVAYKPDNCYHVFYHADGLVLTSTAILDGFTITYGYATGSAVQFRKGGGMYNGNSSSPTINNCAFYLNYASFAGGGMANVGADLTTVTSPTVTNCTFVLNTGAGASGGGGGMYNSYSSPTVTNCLFNSNRGQTQNYCSGGGMFNYYSSPTLNNCTFSKNNFIHLGGGISNNRSSPTLNNCIIWANAATSYGNEFYVTGNSSANITTLNNSCYRNGTDDWGVVAVYIAAPAQFIATNNCITTDPQFVDAASNDFRILGNSPCADAGNNDDNLEIYDIRGAGFARILSKTDGSAAGGTIDIGAYEYLFGTDPLPVELTTFTASVAGTSVNLNWQTATEVNNYGFEIQKSTHPLIPSREGKVQSDRGVFETIGFVEGHGNSNSPKEYSFIDDSVIRNVSYRLKQIDIDGAFEYSEIVEVKLETPTEYKLTQNYPNPFNPSTTISFALPQQANVKLIVYNSLGEEVAELVNRELNAGIQSVNFDGSNLSSGLYFYTISAGNFADVKKMLLLK